jgi:hypothetical protein
MAESKSRDRERLGLAGLIGVHIVVCCLSLIQLANFKFSNAFNPAVYHIFYDPAQLPVAVLAVAAFSLVSLLFVFARFSFGYFAGFYFFTMILGYLWLDCFSDLHYDHRLAGLSAGASALALFVPALFVTSPLRRIFELSATAFDALLLGILALGIATMATGAAYNFRLASLADIADLRDKIDPPALLRYLIPITSSALLPFAFAGFAARRAYWRAGAVLVVLLLSYPITLSKLSLFTPAWLVAVLLLSKFFEARTAVILSLLAPIAAGIVLAGAFQEKAVQYSSIVNFRMVAIPSTAMDIYNDYFSKHDVTHFCQLSFLEHRSFCPNQERLSIVMKRTYDLGNFNASLFTTEGIASVGLLWAPLSAFVCGLVIALGNRLSAGLPAGFILVSGSIVAKVLLDVPLATVLQTHGAGLLFLLWYITPRGIFEPASVAPPAAPAT